MFVVLMYVSFSVTTGRRVCADTARPLRRGPPTERGRSVALYRCGCRRRGPPAPGPACRQRGGFLIGGTVPFFPPAPARPISASACLVSWRYRSASPSAVPHPYSCFRSGSVGGSVAPRGAVGGSVGGSVAPGELSAVRSCLPDRPRPHLALFRRAWCPGGAAAIFPSVPARPIRAFVRSGFGGLERPSRIPIAVRSEFARRPESR